MEKILFSKEREQLLTKLFSFSFSFAISMSIKVTFMKLKLRMMVSGYHVKSAMWWINTTTELCYFFFNFTLGHDIHSELK